jgi:hypothetical protein
MRAAKGSGSVLESTRCMNPRSDLTRCKTFLTVFPLHAYENGFEGSGLDQSRTSRHVRTRHAFTWSLTWDMGTHLSHRVVMLTNMVGAGEVDNDLQAEVCSECSKYGPVMVSVAARSVN